MLGQVTEFGSDGWGAVVDQDGQSYPFHCTAIADGSRSIEAGAAVDFVVVAGRRGRWEASGLSRAREQSRLPADR